MVQSRRKNRGIDGEKPVKTRFKSDSTGFFHIDIAEVRNGCPSNPSMARKSCPNGFVRQHDSP